MVAWMDWPESLVSAQPHRQEIIEDLFNVTKDPQRGSSVNGGMVRELLIAFRSKTGRRPERIIFYRDGVSEGQFNHVLLHEMDAIRKEGYLPSVTFLVVQKRHHTRLFPEIHGRRDMTDKSGNILPGTVVGLMICHPTEFDFYLCSHAGIQGTSRPTHYHVLYDENHLTADALCSLCAVFVVPPAYYSHLAAFRASYYVEGESSDGGSTPGSSGQAVQGPASSTTAVVASMDWIETKQVFVRILSWKLTMQFTEDTNIHAVKRSVFEKLGVNIVDCYVMCQSQLLLDHKVISSIVSDSTLFITPRLRAGQRHQRFGNSDFIRMPPCAEHQKYSDFIRMQGQLTTNVYLHPCFIGQHNQFPRYIVDLSDGGRTCLDLLFELLERLHNSGRTFNGKFTAETLFYVQKFGRLTFADNVDLEEFSDAGFIADMKIACSILYQYFSWQDYYGHRSYPVFMEKLVEFIMHMQIGQGCGTTKKWRSFIFNNCCLMPAIQREAMYLQLHQYVKGLSWAARAQLEHDLGNYPQDWIVLVAQCPALNEVLQYLTKAGVPKNYTPTYLSHLDHCRCFLNHVIRPGLIDIEQGEAILAAVCESLLPELHQKFLHNYIPHKDAQHFSLENLLGVKKFNNP